MCTGFPLHAVCVWRYHITNTFKICCAGAPKTSHDRWNNIKFVKYLILLLTEVNCMGQLFLSKLCFEEIVTCYMYLLAIMTNLVWIYYRRIKVIFVSLCKWTLNVWFTCICYLTNAKAVICYLTTMLSCNLLFYKYVKAACHLL